MGSVVMVVDDFGQQQLREDLERGAAAEVERLKGLGASEVHWDKRPADADYVIMQDPDGNRFCVVQV